MYHGNFIYNLSFLIQNICNMNKTRGIHFLRFQLISKVKKHPFVLSIFTEIEDFQRKNKNDLYNSHMLLYMWNKRVSNSYYISLTLSETQSRPVRKTWKQEKGSWSAYLGANKASFKRINLENVYKGCDAYITKKFSRVYQHFGTLHLFI